MLTQFSPRRVARTIGALFLLTILGGVFAQGFVSERLIVFSDAATTANNILSHRGLFQLGFTFYVIEMTCQVAVAALWYVVLRPVSRPIALTAAFIELSGCIIKSFARVLTSRRFGFWLPPRMARHQSCAASRRNKFSPARWFF